jgi:hypothetical protein
MKTAAAIALTALPLAAHAYQLSTGTTFGPTGVALSETYARDPRFYSGTFCVGCGAHFPLNQFHWDADKEPMDPDLQEEWNAGRKQRENEKQKARLDAIEQAERAELARLQAKYAPSAGEKP